VKENAHQQPTGDGFGDAELTKCWHYLIELLADEKHHDAQRHGEEGIKLECAFEKLHSNAPCSVFATVSPDHRGIALLGQVNREVLSSFARK
jgi:hypothetical protein